MVLAFRTMARVSRTPEILRRAAAGEARATEIARDLGVSTSLVSKVLKRHKMSTPRPPREPIARSSRLWHARRWAEKTPAQQLETLERLGFNRREAERILAREA